MPVARFSRNFFLCGWWINLPTIVYCISIYYYFILLYTTFLTTFLTTTLYYFLYYFLTYFLTLFSVQLTPFSSFGIWFMVNHNTFLDQNVNPSSVNLILVSRQISSQYSLLLLQNFTRNTSLVCPNALFRPLKYFPSHVQICNAKYGDLLHFTLLLTSSAFLPHHH